MADCQRLEIVKLRAISAAKEWFESVTPLVEPFAQVDVDQLGEKRGHSTSNILAWAVTLFEALCAVAHEAGSGEMSLLVIPLGYSTSLDCSELDIASLFVEEWAQMEVPGLYLIRDSQILGFDSAEEYRRTLSVAAFADTSVAYYRCWRTATSEFARALYFVRQ